jgi:uncharacterized protein (TIGR03435 family)
MRSASLLLLLILSAAFGQSAGPVRAFDVASVKLHDGPKRIVGVETSGLRLTASASNLRGLIMWAYDLKNSQVSGSARLLNDDEDTRWDIAAKAEGDTAPTRAQFRQMLQALLADRFKLAVHREPREMPVYALVVGKSGPKFKESAPDASPAFHVGVSGRNYEVTYPKATMAGLTDVIVDTCFPDRPVLDRTGLQGDYDIKLTYTPGLGANRDIDPDPGSVDIFRALEEQLGLKLDLQKGMVEVLVVDHAEKPSAN